VIKYWFGIIPLSVEKHVVTVCRTTSDIAWNVFEKAPLNRRHHFQRGRCALVMTVAQGLVASAARIKTGSTPQ
jgi:hypothetical protein